MLTVQSGAADVRAGVGLRRVLVAPVTVTPSKPLGPSHLKGLFWTDVLVRATAQLADVTYRYSPTTYHPTEQTLAFWEYLDRTLGDADYSVMSEEDIGEHYVSFRAAAGAASAGALRPYAQAVELHGWTHPAGTRVLELWREQYAALGLHDPGLTAHQPPAMGLDEVIAHLCARGMCLDLRGDGGPVYLDATRHGLPLRQIAAADGRPNYMACALRELVPLGPEYDEVVLLCDRELERDYHLLQVVLSELGHTVHRIALGRVPIEGRIQSARHGGWRDTSARTLLDTIGAGAGDAAVRLGMRLYFIAVLGPGQHQSFRLDLLRQCLHRAERLLSGGRTVDPAPVVEILERHRGHHAYVDPYRLTASLLARHRPAPGPDLLSAVYL
jgi:hypothetical protein